MSGDGRERLVDGACKGSGRRASDATLCLGNRGACVVLSLRLARSEPVGMLTGRIQSWRAGRGAGRDKGQAGGGVPQAGRGQRSVTSSMSLSPQERASPRDCVLFGKWEAASCPRSEKPSTEYSRFEESVRSLK